MTVRSRELGAVNLSQGFADYDPPPEIIDCLKRVLAKGGIHQYADTRGVFELRQAICQKLSAHNGITVDPAKNIVVTCGATEAMLVSLQALFSDGDAVMVLAPYYENYSRQAESARVKLQVAMPVDDNLTISKELLERYYNPSVKGVILCNPCNPTGRVYTRDELMALLEFSAAHGLYILSDETYEYFAWDRKHISIASLPGGANRTITILSMGKTYSVTGWRVGYVAAEEEITNRIAAVHDFTTVSAPHVFQAALALAMRDLPAEFYQKQRRVLAGRGKKLLGALRDSGFSVLEPEGGYFAWCGYENLSDLADEYFAEQLLEHAGIATVPGSVFFPAGTASRRVRFTFSKSEATIDQAIERLAKVRELSPQRGRGIER